MKTGPIVFYIKFPNKKENCLILCPLSASETDDTLGKLYSFYFQSKPHKKTTKSDST